MVGGGILRHGVVVGSVNEWFDKIKNAGHVPTWIVPNISFRVVIVKPFSMPLSLAPIVGTYDFTGIWKFPLTRFKESAGISS